jgi:serine/threonine-protein kinase
MLDRRDPPDGQGATIDGTEDTPSASAAGGPALPVRVNPAALPSGPVPFGNEEEPADPLVGSVLAERYEILSRVSRGGMGVVYKARHISLGTLFAIKLIIGRASELSQQKFLREAQLASKVQHPNTVYIADFGLLPEGHPYLAMEYVDGPTLGQALGHGRFEPQRACEIALQLARGIQPIHDKGIVHREVINIDKDCLR